MQNTKGCHFFSKSRLIYVIFSAFGDLQRLNFVRTIATNS